MPMQTGVLGVVRNLARISEALQDVRARHEAARVIVREVVEARVNDMLKEDGIEPLLRLTGIDLDALDAWETTWPRPYSGKDDGWDWRQVVVRLRKRPARVEVAVWFGDELCGLVGGRLSERREVVRIDLLEGRPGPEGLDRADRFGGRSGYSAGVRLPERTVLQAPARCYLHLRGPRLRPRASFQEYGWILREATPMTVHTATTEQQMKPAEASPARRGGENGEAIPPPSLLALIQTAVAPRSILSTMTKEGRRELVRRAAEVGENSGSDDDL